MAKRFVSIWFPHLLADDYSCLQPELKATPVVIAASERGRMKIKGVNNMAHQKGIMPGMVVADCRAIFPNLKVIPYKDGHEKKLLEELALWCLRYTPVAAINEPDGLLLDASGCTHLWGNEINYLKVIIQQLQQKGFTVAVAMADTIGMAWAAARYYQSPALIETAWSIRLQRSWINWVFIVSVILSTCLKCRYANASEWRYSAGWNRL
jgi:protein ImuB